MRELAIAYGSNRQAKKWVNKTTTFDALKERLKVTIRTPESAEEYAKMSKAQRDAAKDHGGFVAGALKGGRRKIGTVDFRSMVALDGDRIDKDFLENYEKNAVYSPHQWLITLLANQAILIHNLKDKEHPKELLTEEIVELLTVPADLATYKTAITEALYKGTKRNVQSEEDPKNAEVG